MRNEFIEGWDMGYEFHTPVLGEAFESQTMGEVASVL